MSEPGLACIRTSKTNINRFSVHAGVVHVLAGLACIETSKQTSTVSASTLGLSNRRPAWHTSKHQPFPTVSVSTLGLSHRSPARHTSKHHQLFGAGPGMHPSINRCSIYTGRCGMAGLSGSVGDFLLSVVVFKNEFSVTMFAGGINTSLGWVRGSWGSFGQR